MENKTYKFGLKGDQRKALVSAMQQLLQVKMNYLGAPTFAYQLGEYHIDREGTVTGPESLNLMVGLLERGFEPEADPSFHLITPAAPCFASAATTRRRTRRQRVTTSHFTTKAATFS